MEQNPSFYSKFSLNELKQIAQIAANKKVEAGDVLLRTKVKYDVLFVLVKGEITYLLNRPKDKYTLFSVAEPGTILNPEVILGHDLASPFDIVASTDSIVLFIQKKKLLDAAKVSSQFGAKIAYVAARQSYEWMGSLIDSVNKVSDDAIKVMFNKYFRAAAVSVPTVSLSDNQDNMQEYDTSKQNPIYELKFVCPICDSPEFTTYHLMNNSQKISSEYFFMKKYEGVSGFASVDYNKYQIHVCPYCLFASERKFHFKYKTKFKKNNFKPPTNFVPYKEKLLKEAGGRKMIFQQLMHKPHSQMLASKLLVYPRSVLSALLTHFLAIECNNIIYTYYDKKYLLRNIEYKLIISKYFKDMGEEKPAADYLEMVINELENVGSLGINNPELDIMYSYHLVKIYIELERYQEAKRIITANLKRRPETKQEKVYFDKIRDFWQDYREKMH